MPVKHCAAVYCAVLHCHMLYCTDLQMGLNFCAGTPAMASMASSSRLWFNFTVNLPSCRSAGGTQCVSDGFVAFEVDVWKMMRHMCVHMDR
jgi:hypothetical protein